MASSNQTNLSIAGKEALFTSNALLSSGSIIAPAVAVATGFMPALAICIVFSLVTYTLVASLVYVPVSLLMERIMPASLAALGIYAPLLITNSLITVRTESKFYRLKRSYMFELAAMYILGYDIALLFLGTVRELLTNGGFFGVSFLPLTVPTASTVFGGFIILALLSAGFRSAIKLSYKKAVTK